MKTVKVEDCKDLVRDQSSNAILSVDSASLKRHRLRRQAMRAKDVEIEDLKNRIEKLESLFLDVLNNRKN